MRKRQLPSPIRKVARIRDKRTGQYLEIIEFPISLDETATVELPPSVIADPSSFERRLRDVGAILPKRDLREHLRAIGARKAPKDFAYEAQTGWSEDRKTFVFPEGAIGESASKVLGVSFCSNRRCYRAKGALIRECLAAAMLALQNHMKLQSIVASDLVLRFPKEWAMAGCPLLTPAFVELTRAS